MSWSPILAARDDLACRAKDAVEAIAASINTRSFTGNLRPTGWEEALLYGYLAITHRDERWAEEAANHLNSEVALPPWYFGLYGGLCGMGWVMEHLSSRLDFEAGEDSDGPLAGVPTALEADTDPCEDIDAALIETLRRGQPAQEAVDGIGDTMFGRRVWRGDYDLLNGLVGFGVYFLERLPSSIAAEGVRLVLDRIEAAAEHTADGVTWFTDPSILPGWQRKEFPNGYYNLGVAHGVPAVAHFLAETAAAGIEVSRALALLEGGVRWLIAHQSADSPGLKFGPWISRGKGHADGQGRLAWCYGDLGIAAILFQVARRAKRADWRDIARRLLDGCLAYSYRLTGLRDPNLCHGVAGVAHIFNRIYHFEDDMRCREAAIAWFERALALRRPCEGIGGFFALVSEDTAKPRAPLVEKPFPAFLDGAIGLALALLAATSSVEPAWDRLLLLSGRTLPFRSPPTKSD